MRSRKRTVWLVVLFTVTGLALTIYLNRHGLLRRYRLVQLRETPSRFEEFVYSTDPAEKEAAIEFLSEPAGKAILFDLYLAEYENSEWQWNVFRNLTRKDMDIAFGCVALGSRAHVNRWVWSDEKGLNQGSYPIPPINETSRETILGLLEHLRGETFRVDRFPRFEFQVVPVGRGQRVSATWPKTSKSRYKERPPFEWRERSDIRFAMLIRAVQ